MCALNAASIAADAGHMAVLEPSCYTLTAVRRRERLRDHFCWLQSHPATARDREAQSRETTGNCRNHRKLLKSNHREGFTAQQLGRWVQCGRLSMLFNMVAPMPCR
eukprot:5837241-Prymnesium_polylepis.1